MDQATKGVWAVLAACSIWGVAPLYYKHLAYVPAGEMLAHRTLWTLLFFGLLLAVQGRLRDILRLLGGAERWQVAISAGFISVNWGIFIVAIQAGHGVEASLGYYIFPLVAVVLGVVLLKERLTAGQAVAVGLAALAVCVLTYGLGVAPVVALALAVTFAIYGLLKRGIRAGAVVSVTVEVLMMAPLAIIWLVLVQGGWATEFGRDGGWFGHQAQATLLLPLSGLITGGPLILFSWGAQRVQLSTLGLTQYLNPSLQALCAVVVLGEPFTRWHAAAFALIWVALALYSAEMWRKDRAARRPLASAVTSGTVVK
jgi:chloramphenicol-sensitive protein RarD